MARVRLVTQTVRTLRYAGAPDPQPEGIPFVPTDGAMPAVRHIPWYRLIATLVVEGEFGDPLRRLPAILDTGAPLTSFPFEVWDRFRDHIRWLDQPPREDVDDAGEPLPWRVSVGGGAWGYRLGRVRLSLTDEDERRISSEMTTCLFLDSVPPGPGPRPPRQAVLGLRTPLPDRRQLRHARTTADLPDWWLEDV